MRISVTVKIFIRVVIATTSINFTKPRAVG
jgi:hypothetical protein